MSGNQDPDPARWQADFDELNGRQFRDEVKLRGLNTIIEQLRDQVREVEAENQSLRRMLEQHMVRLEMLEHTVAASRVFGKQQQSSPLPSPGPPVSSRAKQLVAIRRRKFNDSRGSIQVKEEPSQGDIIEHCYNQDMNLGAQ